MKEVGDKLSEWANHVTDPSSGDLFARSAFNRYYYSVFLIARNLLQSIDPSRAQIQHKAIPELLNGSIIKRARVEIRKAKANEMLRPDQAEKLRNILTTSISDLSNLLVESYDARVTADYIPEELVVRSHGFYKLRNTTLTSATNWPKRASKHCKAIRKVWKELGLG